MRGNRGSSTGSGSRRVLSVIFATALIVAILPFLAGVAHAATVRWVNDDGAVAPPGTSCAAPGYSTISAAVAASIAGDTITVCAGTYAEAVLVDKALTINGPNVGDSALGARVAEATVTSGGTTFQVQASDVTIDGFEIDGDFGVYFEGPSNSNTQLLNSIVTGTSRALSFDGPGTNLDVVGNELISPVRQLHITGAAFSDVKVNENRFSGLGTIFYSGNGSIAGYEFKSNEVLGGSNNMAANITNGDVSLNTFAITSGTLNLQISLHDSTLTDNSFDGSGGARKCLQLFGPQFGLVPSNNVDIADNSFTDCGTYGLQLSEGIDDINVSGNTFTDTVGDAITTRLRDAGDAPGPVGPPATWTLNSDIHLNYNRIVGSTVNGVNNTVVGTLDVENNWWGCNTGPNTAGCDATAGTVDSNPWLVLNVSASPTLAATGGNSTVTADMTDNSDNVDSGGFVPDGTPITWATTTGSLSVPSGTFTSGLSTTVWTNSGSANTTVTGTVDNESESVNIGHNTTDPDVDEGETHSTDPGDTTSPSPADPVQTDVTSPNDNTSVSIAEVPSTEPDQQGYDFFGQQVIIDVSPDGTVADPIIIGFSLDSSILPPGATASTVQVFVDQTAPYDDPVLVATCANPGLVQAVPDPCVAQRLDGPSASPMLDAGDVYIKIYTSTASSWWTGAPNASLPCTITGTAGNDVIFGTGGDDVICALGGNDHVRARGGQDVIYGGSGRDRLYGEPGNDQVWGDDGNDELFGNGDEDELHGGNNNDDIWGAGADDAMFGEAGNDAMHGNDGDETMFGGTGNDEAFGGDGDDYMEGNDGKDLLMGGAGQETIFGGLGDDAIFGNVDSDTLNGGGDEDEISAGEGDDVIDTGNDGDDNLVHAGDGEDTVTAYGGDDEIVTHDGDDTVDAGDGDNVVFTQEGDDTVTAGIGDNFIDTGEGDDSITAGSGDDLLFGGGGDDVINGGDGDNAVDANEGDDLVLLGVAVNAACLSTPQDANECDSTGTAGDNSVTAGGGDDTIVTGDGDDHLLSDGDDDYIDGQNGENGMDGGEGDDDILGGLDHCGAANANFPATCTSFVGADDQSIDGGGGDDRIATGDGDDHVLGQENDDEIWTGAGEDGVDGMEGKDEIHGGAGNDELLGGGANDEMYGDAGDDFLGGGAGSDEMWGGNNDDTIFGDTGNDDIDGDNPLVAGDADDPFSMDECFQNEGTGAPTDCENV